MNSKLFFIILVPAFQLLAPLHAQEKTQKRQELSLDMHLRAEWLPLSPAPDKPDGDTQTMTQSALRIIRAIDPQTERPYDSSDDVLGCNPAHLRRTFNLEKNDFLLGEPILIEFRIHLNGPGHWQETIGGNYRARGRDDNFLFLMRHQDKTWVRDPYAPINVYMGGISSGHEVTQNKPLSYWLAVQRWCAIDKPGTYDLYCFQVAHEDTVAGNNQARLAALPHEFKKDHSIDSHGTLIDSKTGKISERYSLLIKWQRHKWPPSPLAEKMPADIVAYAGKSWNVQNVMDFTHFSIVIKQGSDLQRENMISYWSKVAESTDERTSPTRRTTAARHAICFAQQDDFLPLIKKWIPSASQPSDLYGLAMRPSPKAATMLLKTANPNALAAMYYLHPDRIPDVIPQLIEWLTHENQRMRAESEYRLHRWTGQAFGRDWRGYHHQRPTLEEGRKIQTLWQQWWENNKNSFKPKTR